MGREEGDKPQRPKPKDDVKVFIDPRLRLLVIETVKIINVERQIEVGQMGAGGWSEKVTDEP